MNLDANISNRQFKILSESRHPDIKTESGTIKENLNVCGLGGDWGRTCLQWRSKGYGARGKSKLGASMYGIFHSYPKRHAQFSR